jgi:hypothetical protein
MSTLMKVLIIALTVGSVFLGLYPQAVLELLKQATDATSSPPSR